MICDHCTTLSTKSEMLCLTKPVVILSFTISTFLELPFTGSTFFTLPF